MRFSPLTATGRFGVCGTERGVDSPLDSSGFSLLEAGKKEKALIRNGFYRESFDLVGGTTCSTSWRRPIFLWP